MFGVWDLGFRLRDLYGFLGVRFWGNVVREFGLGY